MLKSGLIQTNELVGRWYNVILNLTWESKNRIILIIINITLEKTTINAE